MRRLLIVRTDAIGDAILWNGALPGLRAAFPRARIAIACRDAVAPIYETAPEIDDIIPVDIAAIARDPSTADEPAARLSAWGADLLLHPTRSREKHTEALVARVRAPRKIALESDLANCTPDERAAFDAAYHTVIPSPGINKPELERHADILRFFEAPLQAVHPRVILTDTDRASAAAALAPLRTDPCRVMVLAPAARWPIRLYPHWAEAVTLALRGTTVIDAIAVVGGAECRDAADSCVAAIADATPHLRHINLCGRTDLRVTIAVIEAARLCIGNETFTAHAAAAVATPSATLLGGGHLGRFMPYDPGSVCAVRPLACAGCDWRCPYTRPHCIRDIAPRLVAQAIRLALTPNPTGSPRVVTTAPHEPAPGEPHAAPLPAWLAPRTAVTLEHEPLPEPAR
ncbi:MAG: glycosyltransferase family 9 protein [Phycisphaerales bacterium]|nr:glycosyltransferase family 9 protein [Planctomycetota bacterium]MCH8508765.1 glycosyltransferase family 9 protein [Phycisphaerales bacterium]